MSERELSGSEIAVIGMSGRFPGAPSVEALWDVVLNGRESIQRFDEAALRAAGVPDADLSNPRYVPASPTLADVELFDADFFRVSPREAKFLDPQHRLFLECAWEALEDAGCDPARSKQRIGVFAGASVSTYLLRNLIGFAGTPGPDLTAIMFGNAGDFLPTRVSYKLDLKGPSVNVQTACSTSLVAIHLGCQNLLAGESDIVIAGGVTVHVPQTGGYLYDPDSILSPDGHCRPFDAGGKGTVFGSGLGIVVLKRLEDAIRDRDRILATILGSAVNNDGGGGKMGYMAPSIAGQTQVLADALSIADVPPETIGFVETHGTGTALGDPIEIASLAQVYGGDRAAAGSKRCALGATKANVGHLDIAAGVLGFVKAVMVVERGIVPPVANFEQPNPALELAKTPFVVPSAAGPWPAGDGPRRAAVSSFGIGGTNAHVILEEAPPPEVQPRSGPELLVVSAKTRAALDAAIANLAAHLERHPDLPLGDVAWTLATGRQRFEHRCYLVASTAEEAAAILKARDPSRLRVHRGTESAPRIVFAFPGQGSQYPGMGRGLFDRDPSFRADVERIAQLFERASGVPVLARIYPAPSAPTAEAVAALEAADTVQLATTTIALAMAMQMERWGIAPSAVVGHSLGEYAAAFVAGVLSVEDVVAAVTKRSRAMAASAPGGMLAVPLDAAAAVAIAGSDLDVAAVNAPGSVVLSGPTDAIARAEAAFEARDVETTRLRVPRANHSRTMTSAADVLASELGSVRFAAPRIPFVSTVTGGVLGAEAKDPAYWAAQVRKTVRFADAYASIANANDGASLVLEVGPGSVLASLVRRQGGAAASTLPARDGVEAPYAPLGVLGELWLHGVDVELERLFDGKRRRVPLPTYPFQRKRHWIAGSGVQPRGSAPRSIRIDDAGAVDDDAGASAAGEVDEDYVAPATDTERAICRMFGELLHVERVGVTADFFDLGGHSLLAMRFLTEVRRTLGAHLALDVVFDAPTARAIAAAVETARGAAPDPIPLADRSKPLPLSFSQERMFFLEQLAPGFAAYNITFPLRLRGPLDEAAFARAFASVVDRHESLRSRFTLSDGSPVQEHDARAREGLVEVVDASGWSDAAIEAATSREASRPFDLAEGPVTRARIVRKTANDRLLLISMHHIVSDGWSFNVLLRELAVAYRAHARGTTPSFAPLAVQYADFAVWQRNDPDRRIEKDLAFFREELAGAPLVLELPTDRPRGAEQSFRGGSVSVPVGPELLGQLERFASARGTTLFVVLLSSFFAWLSQHTHRRDIVVGTTVAGRTHPSTEDLIGLFINAVPIRARWEDGAAWTDLVDEVKARSMRAFQHQNVPFERLVRDLGGAPDLSRPPLFQVDFLFNNFSAEDVLGEGLDDGLSLAMVDHVDPVAKYEMTLEVIHAPGSMKCRFEYAADLFDDESVRAMAARWVALLEALVAQPTAPIAASGVSEVERGLLTKWQGSARAPSGDLVALFDRHAAQAPNALAIVADGEPLAYGELRAQSERAASALAELGVGPGDRVGIDGPVSPSLVAAILGVLRRGAAYVPFDPRTPSARVDEACEDAGVRLVVASKPRPDLGGRVVDAARLPTGGAPAVRAVTLAPSTVAYVIHTSGTTGRPKGVMIPHGAVASYVTSFAERMGLGPHDRVLQLASLAFDLSVEELFGALTSGATLVLRPPTDDLEAILALARRERVTLLDLPTPLWHEIVDGLGGADDLWPELRNVVIGADKADPRRVERWRALGAGAAALHDTYGPTETTIVATWARLTGADPDRGIGRPVPGAVVRILSPSGEPVPPGVVGEIGVAGMGVAQGYLNRPALTAERFVPDPAGSGARLYRTGDLGRWTRDGRIEILGRTDHQIKLRGFRIELGEIEAALQRRDDVASAVVKLWGAGGRDPYLAAYVVPAAGAAGLTPDALAKGLRAALPEYMVPGVFVLLDALPINERGKVDRGALARPAETEKLASTTEYVAPRSDTERHVAEAFRDVLSVPRVSVHDSFFGLGGNSLSAMRLVGRLRRALSVTLPMTVLFDAPVVEALAARIDAGMRAHVGRQIPVLGDRARARLSLSQERLFFLEQLMPEGGAYHIPMALRIRGRLDVRALDRAVLYVMERHEVLRARFTMAGETPVQDVAPVPPSIVRVEDARGWDEARIAKEATAEASRPFALGDGSLVRVRVLDRGDGDQVLLFTLHHIVADGWSMGILVKEIGEAYAAYARGAAPRLPALPIQFADFAAWQRGMLEGDALAEEIGFWRRELEGAPLVLELATDRPRPAVATSAGGTVRRSLPPALVGRLRRLAAERGATLYMVLFAGYYALLSRVAGRRDIVVGTPVAGRSEPATEGLIGMFVNTLPIRVRWERTTSFPELVGLVKERVLRAFERTDIPLAELVEALEPQRDTSRTPLFQTLFVLQNAPVGAHDFGGGLAFEPVAFENERVQFELALDCVETKDGGVDATLGYNRDLFDRETAERLLDGWVRGLERCDDAAALGSQDAAPASVLALGVGERRATSGASFAARLAMHAKERPDAVAVREGERVFTYASFEARTNELAHRLRARGIGPEAVVGVSLERSAELVACVWAVRKAGAAYVALDPELPDARLATMANDANAALVLVARGGAERFRTLGREVIEVDLDEARSEPSSPPRVLESPQNLSYVLFTSGSTGRPKGVMNTVEGLMNRLEWGERTYPIAPSDIVIQKTPYAFDVSVWELFGVLSLGATLEVARAGGHRDPRYLVDLVERQRVTVCHFVPSMLGAFLDELREGEGRSLRRVVASGEALTPEHVARFRAKLPWADLANLYGPTEASIEVTYRDCGKGTTVGARVPLGHPVWNTTTHVYDDEMRIVDRGAIGELCLGGVQVGRGYLGNPALTAERFVPDPNAAVPGARVYRTGDLARWSNAGELEYLGRMDHQVKVRGFRIELGEIEAALRQQSGVRESVVVLQAGARGEPSLAAYVVMADDDTRTGDALRDGLRGELARVLPAYMVPTTVDRLPRLPLTTSGKVDRNALPKPERLASRARVQPRNDAERRVAAIVAELLKVDEVGVDDDFFALGGHSLLAMQLVSKLRAEGIAIGVSDVFAHSTVEGIARFGVATADDDDGFGEAEALDDDDPL